MTNFNNNFLVETESVFVGMGFPIFQVAAVCDKEGRAPGQAVKLVKPDAPNAAKYPFGFKMADAADDGKTDGIIVKGVCLDESGKVVVGKSEAVMTKGTICVEIDTSLESAEFGDKVYWDGSKFKNEGTHVVGYIASNIFDACKVGQSAKVKAAYIELDFAKA